MAAKFFSHVVEVTPGTAPQTQWQARVPANQRTILRGIKFMPIGSTSASAPIKWDFVLQSADGTFSTDDSANIVKEIPAFGASILTTVHITCTVEPTTNTVYDEITLHQQGVLMYRPPTKTGYLILDTGTRWGLRCRTSAPGFPVRYQFFLEE